MMKGCKRRFFIAFAVLLLFAAGCSSGGNSTGEASPPMASASAEAWESDTAVDQEDVAAVSKKVKTGSMEMEAESIDDAIWAIENMALDLGGFVESKRVNTERDYQYASITLRVPAEGYEGLVSTLYNSFTVLDFYDTVEDLSGRYVDQQLRLEMSLAEEARLLELIEKTQAIEDIIQLEMRLGEVRMEIAAYENSLKDIDRSVSLSTLHINLEQKATASIRPVQGLPAKMAAAFKSSAGGVLAFVQGVAVTVVYFSVPLMILIFSAIIGRMVYKRTKK